MIGVMADRVMNGPMADRVMIALATSKAAKDVVRGTERLMLRVYARITSVRTTANVLASSASRKKRVIRHQEVKPVILHQEVKPLTLHQL